MHILFVCPLDPVRWPGAGSHVMSLARSFHSLGHDVTLVHTGRTVSDAEGIRQVSVFVQDHNLGQKLWKDIRLSRTLWRLLRATPADFVYQRFEKASCLPLLIAKLKRIPVIIEVNADLSAELSAWRTPRLVRGLSRAVERLSWRFADQIVAVSEGIAESIRRRRPYGAKLSVVSNGADLNIFRPLDRDDSRQRLGLERGKRYITYAGSFQPWQGLEIVARSAASVIAAHPEAVFVILGDGPEKPGFRLLLDSLGLRRFFVLPGWCSPPTTAFYLGASEICLAPYTLLSISPSRKGNSWGAPMTRSPLKIFTYLSAGRAVISSHFAEAGLLIERLGAGLAVPPESPSSLADAITCLLNNPDRADEMGKNGRRAAEQEFGWNSVARRILEIGFRTAARRQPGL